ncbi:hypothetical protein [Edwardsiella piscicida]|uniref:hypothetical protein n=1 Tax=Edwardsiella piscicida TaxID=1263550 RepID=UPI000D5085FB|nr:hypothetical protein [Edwardsiella piscicida]UCQ42985.1 hypothetical protein DCF39_09260 [Edwardsiella piscicida]
MSNTYHVEIQLRSGEKKTLTASARPDFDGDYLHVTMGLGYFSVLLSELVYVEVTKVADAGDNLPVGEE